MVIWVKFTHLVHWFLKCPCSLLPSPVWPLPICLDSWHSFMTCHSYLTYQVPMQYCLQHWTLLLSPVTSTNECCFCFNSVSSFFLELFLHWSPVTYWVPTNLGSSSFSVLSFCLFILFMGSQGKNTEVVCHSLLQWTMFCQNSPPWPISLGWPNTALFIVSLS